MTEASVRTKFSIYGGAGEGGYRFTPDVGGVRMETFIIRGWMPFNEQTNKHEGKLLRLLKDGSARLRKSASDRLLAIIRRNAHNDDYDHVDDMMMLLLILAVIMKTFA